MLGDTTLECQLEEKPLLWGCVKGHNWMSYCITNRVGFCARVELFGTLTGTVFCVYLMDHYGVISNILCIYTKCFLGTTQLGRQWTKGPVMRTKLVRIRLTWEALDQRTCDEDRAGENQATWEALEPITH